MNTLYLVCAGLGGAVIAIQFVLTLIGVGGDHDHADTHGGDHGDNQGHGNFFFGLLTIRSVAAGVGFFGLGGLTAQYYDLDTIPTLSAACFAGFLSLYSVASLMKAMIRLKHDGTARIENAIGKEATVYLRIPASKAGPGKVTVSLQNRTVECEAYSLGAEIPTGASVRIVRVLGPSQVEVEPLSA